MKTNEILDAVFLIDDASMCERNNPQSSWDTDLRGYASPMRTDLRGMKLSTDGTSEYGVSMKREFIPRTSGKADFFHSFTIYSGEGYYIEFLDTRTKKRKVCFDITAKDGFISVCSRKLPIVCENKTYNLNIEFDIDNKSAEVFFDEKSYGFFI